LHLQLAAAPKIIRLALLGAETANNPVEHVKMELLFGSRMVQIAIPIQIVPLDGKGKMGSAKATSTVVEPWCVTMPTILRMLSASTLLKFAGLSMTKDHARHQDNLR